MSQGWGGLFTWLRQSGGEGSASRACPGHHRLGGRGPLRPLGQKWPPVTELDNSEGVYDSLGQLDVRCVQVATPVTSTTDTSWAEQQPLLQEAAEQWGSSTGHWWQKKGRSYEPCLSAGLCEAGFWVLEETGVKSSSKRNLGFESKNPAFT